MRVGKVTYLIAVALTLLLCLTACGGRSDDDVHNADSTAHSTVIEPGINPPLDVLDETDSEDTIAQSTDEFVDKGEAATIDDIVAAQAKIKSFYFEQSVNYPDGSVFIQVWYKDKKMKLLSSVNSYALNECYYDYEKGTLVTYYIGSSSAMQSDFDPDSSDAPDNPVMEDYRSYTLRNGTYIDDQYCLCLETPEGDLLWVSTKYGFPLKAEYTDSLGERMTSTYSNIKINMVTDEEVSPPAGLEIYYGENLAD